MFIQYDYDIPMCNNKKVYVIDTIISNVKGNIAKGFIFKNDLTLIPSAKRIIHLLMGKLYMKHIKIYKQSYF